MIRGCWTGHDLKPAEFLKKIRQPVINSVQVRLKRVSGMQRAMDRLSGGVGIGVSIECS